MSKQSENPFPGLRPFDTEQADFFFGRDDEIFEMLQRLKQTRFIAVMGIAADDGIVIGTYIQQVIEKRRPTTVEQVREAILEAGQKRIRPALMTSVTTILALLPIFLTAGRGSDVMRPMAVPSVGGMVVAGITWFVVPMAYSALEERRIRKEARLRETRGETGGVKE